MAANITRFEVRENESQTADDFLQGRNSWTSIQGGEQSTELSSYYGGMTPPDKPHIYELHVYALDKMLDLERGFLLNELYREMDGPTVIGGIWGMLVLLFERYFLRSPYEVLRYQFPIRRTTGRRICTKGKRVLCCLRNRGEF